MLRNYLILMIAAVAVVATAPFIASQSANAQTNGVPTGTYKQSCSSIKFVGSELVAMCKTRSGNWATSSLDTSYCAVGDIANLDGSLGCVAKKGSWGNGGATPNGSYKNSCVNIRVASKPFLVLRANCALNGSVRNDASLHLSRCEMGRDIANINGQLTCTIRKSGENGPIHIPGKN